MCLIFSREEYEVRARADFQITGIYCVSQKHAHERTWTRYRRKKWHCSTVKTVQSWTKPGFGRLCCKVTQFYIALRRKKDIPVNKTAWNLKCMKKAEENCTCEKCVETDENLRDKTLLWDVQLQDQWRSISIRKTTPGNGQAWSSPNSRGQWRTEKECRKPIVKSFVVPKRHSRWRDRWW